MGCHHWLTIDDIPDNAKMSLYAEYSAHQNINGRRYAKKKTIIQTTGESEGRLQDDSGRG